MLIFTSKSDQRLQTRKILTISVLSVCREREKRTDPIPRCSFDWSRDEREKKKQEFFLCTYSSRCFSFVKKCAACTSTRQRRNRQRERERRRPVVVVFVVVLFLTTSCSIDYTLTLHQEEEEEKKTEDFLFFLSRAF